MGKLIFSSDELPLELEDAARFSRWRELFAVRYGSADIARLSDRPFFARSEFMQVGDLAVVKSDTTIGQFKRSAQHIATDHRGEFMIAFNESGSPLSVEQRGRDVVVAQDQTWLCSTAEAIECRSHVGSRWVGIVVPRASLLPLVNNADDLVSVALDGSSPAVRHLRRYILFLLGAGEIEEHGELRARTDKMLLDLVALSLGTNRDQALLAQLRGLRGARAQEIVQLIKAGFANPAFSAHTVARQLGLSPRYVQELAQETGTSFTERVRELRLQKSRAMLSDPHNDRLKVSDVALACGFSEISYFNRSFRRRFGCSPTQFRGGAG